MMDTDEIKNRLFSILPMSSLHMIEFLKLLNIRFVEKETMSAAITCTSRPELLLNKEFIETYCKKDEHLFMLVMHELYHIILGHTQLFKHHTEIDNIAFDAVINAILCRMFPGEEYVSFFTSINTDESFPGCILRPKGKNTPERFIPILKNLYHTDTGTYFEVYECISNELEEMLKTGKIKYCLLGNHSENIDSTNNPLLNRVLDNIVSNWPKEMTVNGRDLGGELEDKRIDFEKAERLAQNKMKRLLRKAGILDGNISKRKTSFKYLKEDAVLAIPDYKDRTYLTKSIVYDNPLLYNSTLNNLKITKDSNLKTLVYLDVSGSVINDINHFAPLLLKPYKNKECDLFVFSTKVAPVTYQDFRKGHYKSTGGTYINCIFNHYFSLPKKKQTKRILILTDGYTGQVDDEIYTRIKKEKIEIFCGLFGKHTKEDLLNITKYFEEFNEL